MKKIIFVTLILHIVFLAGCIPNSSQESVLLHQINGYESQLKKQPNNPSLLMEIGGRYKQLFDITHNRHYRKHSIDYFGRYMAFDANNPQVQKNLYYSLYSLAIDSGKSEDLLKLNKLFNNMTTLTKQQVNPPALAELLSSSTIDRDFNTEVSLLRRAIKEQPYATLPYYYLYGMYASKNHNTLAFSVLKQGADFNPSNTTLSSMLAYRYLKLGKSKICTGKQASPIQKSIDLYNDLIKNNPKNETHRLNLANAYFYIGKERLALVHYKAATRLKPNEEALWGSGYAYIILGNLEKAEKAYTEALKLDSTVSQDSGDLALIAGDYLKAKNIYRAANSISSKNAYINLKYKIAEDFFQNNFNSPLAYIKDMDDWEKRLYDYYNENINDEKIIDYAKDACQLTEAYFLQAIKAKQQQNQEKYQLYLKKVVEQKVYIYSEYIMAKGMLNRI